MGKIDSSLSEMAIAGPVSGTFTDADQASDWVTNPGVLNIFAKSAGATGATFKVQCTPDAGTTIYDVSKNEDGDLASYTPTSAAGVKLEAREAEEGIMYRLYSTAHTDDVDYRISA